MKNDDQYGIDGMKFLSDLEHVRMRAGLYIGGLGEDGLHHLLQEVLDNSLDEALAGHVENINLVLHQDGSVSITDDGRGIPTEFDEQIGKSALEGAFTVLKYSGKFDSQSYEYSAGLHGMGVKAVNFLSSQLTVDVFRNQKHYRIQFDHGVVNESGLQVLGHTVKHGTAVRFLPDPEKFETPEFDVERLKLRIRDAAILNPNVRIHFHIESTNESFEYFSPRGLVDWIDIQNRSREKLFSRSGDALRFNELGERKFEVGIRFSVSSR